MGMSSQNRNECTPLREAQRNYRRAWNRFTTEVESFQSALNHGLSTETVGSLRERVDQAACEYRIARDELAQVLLTHDGAETMVIDAPLERVTAAAGSQAA
jgi:hypothetical protein